MSKMSQIHLDLCEQANRLGFESIEEAEANGYHIAYDSTGWKLKLDMAKAHEQAHKEWEKERDELLERLEKKQDKLKRMLCDDTGLYALITDTINFIKKGEV